MHKGVRIKSSPEPPKNKVETKISIIVFAKVELALGIITFKKTIRLA